MAPGLGTCKFKVGTYSRLGAYFKTFLAFMVGTGGWHKLKVGTYSWLGVINFFGFQAGHRAKAFIQGGHLLTFLGFQGGTGGWHF